MKPRIAPSSAGAFVAGYTPAFGTRLAIVIRQLGGLKPAAARIGVSSETLANWRDGRREPKVFSIGRLAEAAGVSLDWLIGGRRGEWLIGENGALEAIRHDHSMSDRRRRPNHLDLMSQVMTRVDAFLLEHDRQLDAERKMHLISTIFDILMQGGERIDSGAVDKLLYLAVSND